MLSLYKIWNLVLQNFTFENLKLHTSAVVFLKFVIDLKKFKFWIVFIRDRQFVNRGHCTQTSLRTSWKTTFICIFPTFICIQKYCLQTFSKSPSPEMTVWKLHVACSLPRWIQEISWRMPFLMCTKAMIYCCTFGTKHYPRVKNQVFQIQWARRPFIFKLDWLIVLRRRFVSGTSIICLRCDKIPFFHILLEYSLEVQTSDKRRTPLRGRLHKHYISS